jgi:protein-S-isoprenylcysteine O-methyltransferase Ste14
MTIYAWLILALWLTLIVYWAVSAGNMTRRSGIAWNWWREIAVRLALFGVVVLVLQVMVLAAAWPASRLLALNERPSMGVTGFGLAMLGIGLAIVSRAYLGGVWDRRVSNRKNPELVTTGPYALVRHPLYGGLLLAMIGSAIGQSLLWMLPLIVYAPIFVHNGRREERHLLEQFPELYSRYMQRTKMLLPYVL